MSFFFLRKVHSPPIIRKPSFECEKLLYIDHLAMYSKLSEFLTENYYQDDNSQDIENQTHLLLCKYFNYETINRFELRESGRTKFVSGFQTVEYFKNNL